MKIKWVGHACFMIISDAGVKIITGPYITNENLKYGEINESADIVTVSHEHGDHNNVAAVQGNPEIVRQTATVKGIEFKGISTYHDDTQGQRAGKNTILCFEVDGIKICHLGDLGHPLSDEQVAELGEVDVLLIPVGGHFTIDAEVASQTCNQIMPKVVIPMHYKNKYCNFPIAEVDEFLQGKKNVKKNFTAEVKFKNRKKLPSKTQIIVLPPKDEEEERKNFCCSLMR